MKLYQLIHTIKSSETRQKLENYLACLSVILNFETEVGCYSYEIETDINKKEFIKLFGSFVKELSITNDERVVLYDPEIQSGIFELPGENEKIILNGDITKENQVEEIILMIFERIRMKLELKEIENKYFDSPTNNTYLN